MRRSLLPVCAFVLFVSLLVSAQANLGHVSGVVRSTIGAPLSGATVVLSDGSGFSRTTTSGASGEFSFRDVPPGVYTIAIAISSVEMQRVSVAVKAEETARLTVSLRPAPASTPADAAPQPVQTESGQSMKQNGVVGGIVGGVQSAPAVRAGYAGGTGGGRYLPPFNTETYDKIDDNRWTEVGRTPLSTFSIDVDTASYANTRRFLMQQAMLPPKDAVRIEELINYFTYDYNEPRGEAPVSITATLGPCPWNPKHQLALVGLQARHIDRSQTPPRNLVFLVDVSGSMMTPQKLPLVKASLTMLTRNLTKADRIALVAYAGASGLVLPSTPGDDTSTIVEALQRLEGGGSTNGGAGLKLAYDVARQHFIKGGVNRVVLATDGDFNVGVTNQGELIRLIEENRESGVTLSVLGFGMGNLKDSTMEKLADRGNGNYSYIDSLSEAQKVLVDEAGGTLVTVAKDVKLQIEFNPRVVSAYRLIGYENRLLNDQDFNDDKKDAGDMGAGHTVTALYELAPAGETLDLPGIDPLKYQTLTNPAPASSRDEAMTVKVRYKRPDGDQSALLSLPVPSQPRTTEALGFASAVAEFGMLLRDSEFKGSSSYADALRLATDHRGRDTHGHRAEFARLVQIADSLSSSERRERRER
jgi:Ca-activated chloride channel family protein